jgi:7,8-dihydropterin-6-yl-methyl-4-(beta-D-ribofuranosyl)aminobenzene 5'-phosphate synthase
MINLKILFDSNAEQKNILTGWGFSCLVDNCILFDAGADEKSLLHNMKNMGVRLDELEAVVISHEHLDHTGALWGVLKMRAGIKVYACPGFSEEFKKKVRNLGGELIESDTFVGIRKNIYVTEAIQGDYKMQLIEEQALVVKTKKGITVITGCAHPGIVKIVKKAQETFPKEKIYCVLGGFHLKGKRKEEINTVIMQLKNLGVEKIGPTHCSGEKAMNFFKEEFGGNYITVAAGKVFEV